MWRVTVGVQKPGVKAQGLGAELRATRKAGGKSMKQVAELLDWSEAKVSRAETGRRNISSEEVAALLAIYEVTGPDRDRLMAMARTPDEPGWLETVRRGLPSESIALATYEAHAQRVTDWSPLLVPGLLQTMDYTRAYMLADHIPEPEIGARLMARQRRQQILDRVTYVAYLDETVLHRRVGSRRIVVQQLRHICDMTEDGRVTLRLVPVDVDAHPGLIGGFMMLESESSPPVVHIEMARSGVFLSDAAATDHYVQTVTRLSELSLNPGESVMRVRQTIRVMEGDT